MLFIVIIIYTIYCYDFDIPKNLESEILRSWVRILQNFFKWMKFLKNKDFIENGW